MKIAETLELVRTLPRSLKDGIETLYWAMTHFGALNTNRQVTKRTITSLVELGIAKSVGDVVVCDDDGATIYPERYREGFTLTDLGMDCHTALMAWYRTGAKKEPLDTPRAREAFVFAADHNIDPVAMSKLPIDEILHHPIMKKLNLVLNGGQLQYRNTPLEQYSVSVKVYSKTEHKGGILNAGEDYTSFGDTFAEALVNAIVLANAMANYRGSQVTDR